jgi:hypothetical protein
VLFVAGALVVGLLVGAALGGSITRLERLTLTRLRLIVAAIVIQTLGTLLLSGVMYAVAIVASFGFAGAFLLRNPHLPGRGLLLGGLGLNALVISTNAAMPVSADAASRAGVDLASIQGDARHALVGSHTHLPWLADRIPLVLPWQPQVLSIGDVLVAAGVGLLIAGGMCRGAEVPPVVPVRHPPPDLPYSRR